MLHTCLLPSSAKAMPQLYHQFKPQQGLNLAKLSPSMLYLFSFLPHYAPSVQTLSHDIPPCRHPELVTFDSADVKGKIVDENYKKPKILKVWGEGTE